MNFIILLAILISGTVFGSFFTLAVWRIPRHEDITHVRSYCPKCNHRLEFLDLIPVWSYIFLGGKCRYCKDKIRPRYLLLEIFSGLVFLLIALSYKINYLSSLYEFFNLGFIYLFICGIFISGGIDKEKFIIPNGVIIYELCVSIIYIIFRYVYDQEIVTNIFGVICLPLILLLANVLIKKITKDESKLPFGMGDIKYLSVIGLFLGFGAQIVAFLLAIFITGLYILAKKIKDEIPFGYYLSIATVITIVAIPHINEFINLLNLIVK